METLLVFVPLHLKSPFVWRLYWYLCLCISRAPSCGCATASQEPLRVVVPLHLKSPFVWGLYSYLCLCISRAPSCGDSIGICACISRAPSCGCATASQEPLRVGTLLVFVPLHLKSPFVWGLYWYLCLCISRAPSCGDSIRTCASAYHFRQSKVHAPIKERVQTILFVSLYNSSYNFFLQE